MANRKQEDTPKEGGHVETLSLPKFLERNTWTDTFREKVLPACVYLQITLGARMLAEPSGNGVLTPDACQLPKENEYQDLLWDERGGNIPKQNREIVALPSSPGRGPDVTASNKNALAMYLRNLERALLGSYMAEGATGQRHEGHFPKDVPPEIMESVTPFPALLGDAQVDAGDGGYARGFQGAGAQKPYLPPCAGEERRFEISMLNKMLDGMLEAVFGAGGDESFVQNVFVLAGYGLIFSELREHIEGAVPPNSTPTYTGHPAPFVQPRILFPRMMPNNSIYIIDPMRICIHADPFCEITTSKADGKILRIRSRIAHSLLHQEEEEMRRKAAEAASDPQGYRISVPSLGLKEGHGAILAVIR